VIADVIDEHLARTTVFSALDQATDAGLSSVILPERRRVGEKRFQELNRNDFSTFELDWLDARDADVLKHAEMRDVLVAKRHPEANALEAADVLDQ
jgi:hypothetical protein